jgi:hypothetical protein
MEMARQQCVTHPLFIHTHTHIYMHNLVPKERKKIEQRIKMFSEVISYVMYGVKVPMCMCYMHGSVKNVHV